jgi:hypothetical protein
LIFTIICSIIGRNEGEKMYKFIVLLCLLLCILGCSTAKVNPFQMEYSGDVVLIQSNEISVDYEIKNDLAISWKWKVPQMFEFFNTKNMSIKYEMITMDDTSFGMFLATFDYNNYSSPGIRPEDIIRPLVIAYPKSPKYLRAIITKYNDNWTEKEQWIFNIDISNIDVIISGEEMKPGIFTRFVGQWVPETITLEEGQWFMANAYYLITSHAPKPGEPEIYETHYAVFKVDNNTEIIHNEDGKLNLNSGSLLLQEMHLRKVLINGNSYDGFTLVVTPESTNIFKVEEGSVRIY